MELQKSLEEERRNFEGAHTIKIAYSLALPAPSIHFSSTQKMKGNEKTQKITKNVFPSRRNAESAKTHLNLFINHTHKAYNRR